jgi:hypothetical protein
VDIPYELILALGIYLWGTQQRHNSFFDDGGPEAPTLPFEIDSGGK